MSMRCHACAMVLPPGTTPRQCVVRPGEVCESLIPFFPAGERIEVVRDGDYVAFVTVHPGNPTVRTSLTPKLARWMAGELLRCADESPRTGDAGGGS